MIRLLIRADASAAMGVGHVMRTLAIAEVARDREIDVAFITSPLGRTLVDARGFAAHVAGDVSTWTASLAPDDLVVFDGYGFTAEQMTDVGALVRRTGAVDDLGLGTFPVDVLLNPSMLATATDYHLPVDSTRLLGPHHALIRSEFHAVRNTASRPCGETLLVTLGGTDPRGLTAPLARRLSSLPRPFSDLLVLRGPGAAADLPDGVEVIHDPRAVAPTFVRATAAIAAAGGTTWELAFLGVPTALVAVADNQLPVLETAAALDLAIPLGTPDDLDGRLDAALARLTDPVDRDRLSARAAEVVDGAGATRFLDALLG